MPTTVASRRSKCWATELGHDAKGIIDTDLSSHIDHFKLFLSGDTKKSGLFWGLQPVTVAGLAGKLLFHEVLLRGRGTSHHAAPIAIFIKNAPVTYKQRRRLLQMTLEMLSHFDGEEQKKFSVNLSESFLDEGTLAMLEALRKIVIVEFNDWPSIDCLQRLHAKEIDVFLDDVKPEKWEALDSVAHLIKGIKIDYPTSLIVTENDKPQLSRDTPNTGMKRHLDSVDFQDKRALQHQFRALLKKSCFGSSFIMVLECSLPDDVLLREEFRVGFLLAVQGQEAHAEVKRVITEHFNFFEDRTSHERGVPLHHRISCEALTEKQLLFLKI